jgi:hypothetical protein
MKSQIKCNEDDDNDYSMPSKRDSRNMKTRGGLHNTQISK